MLSALLWMCAFFSNLVDRPRICLRLVGVSVCLYIRLTVYFCLFALFVFLQ